MADQTFDNLVVNNHLGIGITEPAAQLHIAATEGISSKVFLESINGSCTVHKRTKGSAR